MNRQNENKEIRVSEFPNVRSKSAQDITLEQFVANVRGERFQRAVGLYRKLLGQRGKEGEAKQIKERMACIVPAGICKGGHKVSDLQEHSGLLCIDLDHTDDRTDEILRQVQTLPWVTAAFISISGKGIKLLAKVEPTDVQKDYEALYHAVGRSVTAHVRHPYDEKCKILTQPCFYSWHPQAYYNPNALPFIWQAEETYMEQKSSDGKQESNATPQPREGEGFLLRFLDSFEQRNPFRRGQRNDIALKLGRAAASKGFSKQELEEIIQLFSKRYANADFSESDVRQRVLSGYQYFNNLPKNNFGETRVHFEGSGSYEPSFQGDLEEQEAEVLEKNNKLRASAPCIPEEVFPLLPPFLGRCLKHAGNARERDLMLLGSLNSCSALFPEVRFYYKQALYSPHFYLATVAPAGAGKSVMGHTSSLLNPTQSRYEAANKSKQKAYEQALLKWEQEQQEARKNKRTPDITQKPEEPKPCHLKISANTSKARLIESLANAGRLGCYASTTEINTLVSATMQDYGRFDDILCKAAHHEEVSLSFKNSGAPIMVPYPCLALNLTGTQEQFQAFFRSLEVGLYSRFAIYTREAGLQWESCAPNAETVDLRQYYTELGKELLEMHVGLLKSPTLVTFSQEQWQRHETFFSDYLQQALVNGNEAASGIVFRHGLLCMRLAAILTIFRKWDDFRMAKEYQCCDNDFTIALHLVHTLLEHSLLMSSTLPATGKRPVCIKKFNKLESIFPLLPKKFTYTQFIEATLQSGYSESTGKRLLKKLVECKLIVKQDDKYVKKRKCSTNGGSYEPEPQK